MEISAVEGEIVLMASNADLFREGNTIFYPVAYKGKIVIFL